jgi:aminocarboxymuconate-semialdehyde decarboxylase
MRIDAHMHFTPAGYQAELTARSLAKFPSPAWDPDSALAFLDANGVDLAVLSLAPPGVAFGDHGLGDHLARLVNEATAAALAAAPGHFAGLAVLPLPDVDRALSELRYALDVLELDGVVLLSHVLGRYPCDPGWAPLLDELDARAAHVLLHPAAPPYALPLARASRRHDPAPRRASVRARRAGRHAPVPPRPLLRHRAVRRHRRARGGA